MLEIASLAVDRSNEFDETCRNLRQKKCFTELVIPIFQASGSYGVTNARGPRLLPKTFRSPLHKTAFQLWQEVSKVTKQATRFEHKLTKKTLREQLGVNLSYLLHIFVPLTKYDLHSHLDIWIKIGRGTKQRLVEPSKNPINRFFALIIRKNFYVFFRQLQKQQQIKNCFSPSKKFSFKQRKMNWPPLSPSFISWSFYLSLSHYLSFFSLL